MEQLTNFWGNLKKCVECSENSNCYSNHSCGHIAEAIAKLRDYEDLEEQGLLPRLPCKVGDTVYKPYLNTILERKVDVINIYRYTMRIHLCNTSFFVEPEDFGKTVFLTQAEAEEALKRMKREE